MDAAMAAETLTPAQAPAKDFLEQAKRGGLNCALALLKACLGGSQSTAAKLLRESGTDLNALDARGATPLMAAVALGSDAKAICKLLLDCGADVNARSSIGRTALQFAMALEEDRPSPTDADAVRQLLTSAKRAETRNMLLEAGARPDKPCFWLCVGAARPNVGLLRALMAAEDPFPAGERSKLLELALKPMVQDGQGEMCRYLLTEACVRSDLQSQDGEPLLSVAAGNGHLDICKLFLEAGVRPDRCADLAHNTPLHVAASKGQYAVCELFLAQAGVDLSVTNIDTDRDRFTPLHLAASAGHTDVAKLLIRHGADIGAKSGLQRHTPLYRAACGGRAETFRALMEAGADITERAPNGDSMLHAVAKHCHDAGALCKLLLETRLFSVSDRGKGGKTVLHRAASGRDFATVNYLIEEAGADVRARCDKGRTPLHVAAKQGQHAFCPLLVTHGCSFADVDDGFLQPLHLAAESVRGLSIRPLVEMGADPRARVASGPFRGFSPLLLVAGARTNRRATVSEITIAIEALMETAGLSALDDFVNFDYGEGPNALQLTFASQDAGAAHALLNCGARFPRYVTEDDGGTGGAAAQDDRLWHAHRLADEKLQLTRPASCLHERWDRRLAALLHDRPEIRTELLERPFKPQDRGLLRWVASLPADVVSGMLALPSKPKQRDEMVSPLSNDAWQRRKDVVCCYFETRRVRREAAAATSPVVDATPAPGK